MDEPPGSETDQVQPRLLQEELVDVLEVGLQARPVQWSLRDQDGAPCSSTS